MWSNSPFAPESSRARWGLGRVKPPPPAPESLTVGFWGFNPPSPPGRFDTPKTPAGSERFGGGRGGGLTLLPASVQLSCSCRSCSCRRTTTLTRDNTFPRHPGGVAFLPGRKAAGNSWDRNTFLRTAGSRLAKSMGEHIFEDSHIMCVTHHIKSKTSVRLHPHSAHQLRGRHHQHLINPSHPTSKPAHRQRSLASRTPQQPASSTASCSSPPHQPRRLPSPFPTVPRLSTSVWSLSGLQSIQKTCGIRGAKLPGLPPLLFAACEARHRF